MTDKSQPAGRAEDDLAPANPSEVIAEECVVVDGVEYRVVLRHVADRHHRWQIERDGTVVAQHDGVRPDSWPDADVPVDVLEAVERIAIQLSW